MMTNEKARAAVQLLKDDYKVTYQALANELEVSAQHVCNFAHGRCNFRADKIKKLEVFCKKEGLSMNE